MGYDDAPSKEANVEPVYETGTLAERKLVRKIDLFLLPCIWIVYLLSYMVSLICPYHTYCDENTDDVPGPFQSW